MTRLLPTPVVFACALAGSLTAAAQEPASGGSTDLAPIAVTGSRIRGVMIDGAWPLTTIERDELLDSGHQRLGDFLQELPFTSGSPLNTQTSRRGQGGGLSRGIETVELRGLGPERTLVLLNGRRFVPGGNGASGVVDVGMLPIAMVDRIEIFKAGASVEYGADALAGVINVITREPFDGVELSASAKAAARGDGETGSVTALAGRTFARGGFLGGFSWTDQSPVSKGDRRFSRTRLSLSGPGNEVVFDGSSAPPSGQYRTSFGPLTLIDGRLGTGLDDFRPFVEAGPDTDRYNFNPFEDLLQASERFSLFGQGEWLVGDVNVFAEALYHRRDSSQQLAPLPFFTTREQGVVVDAGNVYNPFRETLTDVRRRLVEAGPRTFSQDNEAWRGVVGADGRIGGWFWDLSLAHGRNETDQVKTGDLLDDRLAAALGPSFRDADGVPRCGAPGGVVAGCVPLNVFGGPGSITPEMLAYVGTTLRDSGFNEQTVFDANLAGDLLDLPAGPLAMAAGIEWREERALDRPDPESQAGNTTGNARALTRGSFESREAYLEFAVPLAADRPWARSLDLDLGARLVDFSNFGSDSVFEIGAGWRPTDTLSLRGAWSQAFRAPNVGELFGGRTQANPIVADPCADFAGLSDVEILRCIAQGVPADGSFDQSGEETPELAGGNPALGPEHAELVTLGVSWRPAAWPDARLALDFYDITIDDGIGALGADAILGQCLETGAEAFCGAIVRDASGAIEFVEAQLQNLARETARGIDATVEFSHDAAGGRLAHRLLASHVAERELVAFPGADPLFGAGGYDPDTFGAIPEWRARYALDWRRGAWSLGWQAHWIDAVKERGGEVFPGTVNRAGSVVYHDLTAGWSSREGLSLSLGVDNVTDVRPPFFANADEANTDLATYRALGTTLWLRLDWRSDWQSDWQSD